MKLTKNECLRAGRWMGLWLIGMALGCMANGQAVSTTTVQGTVYLANGQPGAGTLNVSWPAFTTANNQAVTAGRMTVTIAPDGFMSVNLAPNLGATPAGLYYTAVYYMSDGTTSTEYWVVPSAAQAALGQVRAQLMPAAQAVQAVNKAYVDQSIAELSQDLLTATGGTMSGPLILSGDPTQALQAADKHYVDTIFGAAVPLAGGSMTGPLATLAVNGVQAPVAGSAQTTLQAAISAAGTNGALEIPPAYAGTDGFTNPNGVYVADLRQTGSQQFKRSVKEFGAVCDGVTDDTNALQAALNYAQTHAVALTIPQGTCKTRTLIWHGESIGGLGKQVSALMGFPGQDVLTTVADSANLLSYTRIHDLTIYVDQSLDVSCSAAEGRAPAGSCGVSRLLEGNSIFSRGGNGLTGTPGTGAAWAVGNCAIAMPAATGAGGNGLRVAEIENLEIVATGVDPMAQYTGAHSTHTCGMYLAQWPQWSEFRNIDIRGLNTGIVLPALPGATPAGLNADSNRWQNITIQATHGFTAAAGSNNVMDDVVLMAGNSAATAEPPTGLVLDLTGTQQGWTVRNAAVLPVWNAVQPQLTVIASGGAVTAVTAGPEHGLGFDPYGTQVPLKFSGSCTAQATANVNTDGSIGTITVAQGGAGCSGTTTASVNAAGTWDTAAPVNLIGGQNVTLFGGNLLKGNGGYTVWNAAGSQSYGAQLGGGGGTLPGGGIYAALVANTSLGSVYQADQFAGADFGAKLQACLGSLSAINGGTCDARNFSGNVSMGSNLTISTANATVLLPCATISTANQLVVTAGTRNAALRGCALRGTSSASGSQGGTVFNYSGTGAMVQVGDPAYVADTPGFHMDNVAINTTAANTTAKGLAAYRTQEMDLESLYFLGNSNQTGMTLDGTGNYTGGTFFDNAFTGFQTAVNAIGHQISNPATTDWMNASTFVRLHIDCPTSGGSPVSGTYGINLQQGDGNTFTGGDVEGCSTALHLGPNAQNNTIVGLRNENSTNQVVADAGSSYNNWMTGGTMFTGQLTDNGTRNSFLDTFHRSFNGLNGDWYGSQKDATVTNHYRLGIGAGNERGLLDRYQTDYGYRWTMGLSDAAAGEQFYQLLDELNNVYRLSIGQYNNGQSSTNNQTVINAAGTGAIVLNGSANAGTGGVVFGSGGTTESTVATINNTGNAQFNGTLQVGGPSTFTGSTIVKNQADAEIDATLWAGLTVGQKESFIYKDWNGNSQWYMEKDASNNWELNSATDSLDHFKAYQTGDDYINAGGTGAVRINNETNSGTGGFIVYSGGTSPSQMFSVGASGYTKLSSLVGTGHRCVYADAFGGLNAESSDCGSSVGGSGTVSTANAGQIAYYTANGTTVGGLSTVPLTAGGTGASTAAGALANLGGVPLTGGTMTGWLNLSSDIPTGHQAASANAAVTTYSVLAYGAKGDLLPIGHNVTVQGSLTSGSNVLYVPSGSFSSADAGKYAVLSNWSSQPFSTTPSVAQITAVNDAQHLVLSKAAAHSTNVNITWGTDNVPAFNACEAAVAQQVTVGNISAACTIPPGNYLMATSPYYVLTGAQDDGSYGTPAGGSGALITATMSGGQISSYTVSNGGSGYTPNSILQLSFSGGCPAIAVGPCGLAFATANTNSSGQVVSVNPIYPGFGYTSAPTVSAVPLGGDGAAATVTETGGTMNTPVLTSGGAGYTPNSTLDWLALGGGCTNIANWSGMPVSAEGTASTNSNGQASGTMTVTTNATGCTSSPTIIFGDYACNTGTAASPVWGQCSNMTPVNPIALPTQVYLFGGVGFQGNGASVASVWDGQSVDTNEPAIFGGNITDMSITGPLALGGFIDIAGVNLVNTSTIRDLTFYGAIGMWTANTDLGSVFNNLTFYSNATWINGGVWQHRADYSGGYGGFSNAESINNIIAMPNVYGAISSKIDDWFANNFWRPEFSANSTDFLETCKFPQAANQRQTSRSMTGMGWANTMCYRGITSLGMALLARDAGNSESGSINNLIVKGANRYIFYGPLQTELNHPSCENCTPLTSDPYRNAAVQEGAIVLSENGFGSVNDVIWSNGPINRCLWSINTQGDPGSTSWTNTICYNVANGQQPQNQFIRNSWDYPYGLTVGKGSYGFGTVGLYGEYGNTQALAGEWQATGFPYYGVEFTGSDGSTDVLDINLGGMTLHKPLSAPSVSSSAMQIGSGASMTGSVGNGGLAQETTNGAKTSGHCVQFDGSGNTVDAGAACSSSSGTVTSFAAPSASWPTWLVPAVTNTTTAPSLAVSASSIPNSALANTAVTVNGTSCALGGSCTVSAAVGAAAFSAVSLTSYSGTLATAGAAFTNGTVALSHSSTTTINVSGLVNGASFNLVLSQDATGGNTLTLGAGCTWMAGSNSGFVPSTTPALTALANGKNVLAAIYDGTNCYYNVR